VRKSAYPPREDQLGTHVSAELLCMVSAQCRCMYMVKPTGSRATGMPALSSVCTTGAVSDDLVRIQEHIHLLHVKLGRNDLAREGGQ
jgi:hypothetical protein